MSTQRAFLFRHRDFGLFWTGMLFVNVAVQVEAVTIGWQIYALSRETRTIAESAFLVGMVGLAQFLPLFLLSLIAGSVADRQDRRRIVLITLSVEILCVLGLLVLALDPAPHLGAIFGIAAVFGAARAFQQPAASAVLPMLVPRPDMPQAISLKSLSWQGAVIIGPWIGGLLVASSSATAYGGAAVCYVSGLLFLLFIRQNTRPISQPGGRIAQIREGLVYVWTNKIIFGAISLDLFAVLLGGATALLPAFASDILDVGPDGFGLLRSGPAIGAAAMALYLSRWPLKRRAGARMFAAVGAFGLATVVFALSRSMTLSLIALAVLGAADMISVYVRQTLVQIITPDHMRGRVSSVSGLFISGSNELGEFESGVVARLVGPVMAAVIGGCGTLVVTGVWWRFFPDLRNADRLDGGPELEVETVQPQSLTAPAS